MFLSDNAIRKPVFTTMLIAGLFIFGLMGYQRMGVDLFPDVDFPVVTVQTTLPGASPEVMDINVTDVLEEQINTIAGIERLQSFSSEGQSLIMVQFILEKDLDIAAQDVRDKVSIAQHLLPTDINPPIVTKQDIAAQPIMWISISGTRPYRDLSYFADKIAAQRIQTVRGVGAVARAGLRERQIRIWLNPYKLKAHGITPMDVGNAIQTKHLELPGGRIESDTRDFTIRILGEYESPEELAQLPVAYQNGLPIRLMDIARIEDGFEDIQMIARFNQLPSIGLGIRKQPGANTVAVAEEVKTVIEQLKLDAPPGIYLDIAYDSSEFIERSMNDAQFDIFAGAMLTSLIILLFFRNFRITLISVIAIPTSLIGSFAFLNALGFSINNMTMLAMSLAVGMVIDDTIIVLENIFRHLEKGESAITAAMRGTGEIAFASISATISIAAVFIPVAFMEGFIGRFFFQFGLTVAITILISLFIALTLSPMLCSRFLKIEKRHGRIYNLWENIFNKFDKNYQIILRYALHHRITVIFIAITSFLFGIFLLTLLHSELVPQSDQSMFFAQFKTAVGTPVTYTNVMAKQSEEILFNNPEIKSAFVGVGFGFAGLEPNRGIMFVLMNRPNERTRSQQDLILSLRQDFNQIPGFNAFVDSIPMFPTGGGQRPTAIQYIIQGPDKMELYNISNRIIDQMRQSGGFVDMDTDLTLVKPEVKVYIDRKKAEDLGVDIRSLSQTIFTMFGGINVGSFKEGGDRYDIRLSADLPYRIAQSDIGKLIVRANDGRLVPLADLVQIEQGIGPNSINRFNRQHAVTIYSNLEGKSLSDALTDMERIIQEELPQLPGYAIQLGGISKEFEELQKYMLFAIMLSIIIVYMVLASQFESFIHPFTIMLSLPLATVGVFGALFIAGNTLNIFSFIGILMLIGIATRNAILLVDYTNKLRLTGMDRTEAILTAGPVRLRPILMTVLTTMFGILPVALALAEGGEIRQPMAIAVIGGLFTATLLTLVVIPVVYSIFDDIGIKISQIFGKKSNL